MSVLLGVTASVVEGVQGGQSPGSGTKQKLASLQAGRGIAALAVLAYHLSLMMGDPRYGGREVFAQYTWRGNIGVDFFFVLSGFIIFSAHIEDVGNPRRILRYAWNRWSRVYPIYWVYNAVLIGLLVAGAGVHMHLPNGIAAWITDTTLIRFSSSSPIIPPAWTLFHEIFFYLLFSLVIVSFRIGVVALSVWFTICCGLNHYPGELDRTAWNVYTSGYNLNFFIGMLAFLAVKQGWARGLMVIPGTLSLVSALVAESRGVPVSPLVYALAFGVTISGVVALESNGRLRTPSILVFLGNASYSIYLLHESLCGLVLKGLTRAHFENLVTSKGVYAATLICAMIGSIAPYWFLERPLLKALRRIWPRRVASASLAGNATSAAAIVSAIT